MAQRTCEVIVLRHASADKATDETYLADIARPLSPRGKGQGQARRTSLGNPRFDAVLTSLAERAVQTGMIVSGYPRERIQVSRAITFPDAADGKDEAAIDELFNGLGYGTLKTYCAHAPDAMKAYGARTWSEVGAFIDAQKDRRSRVLVVGHAVLIASTFYESTVGRGAEANRIRNGLLTLNLGEAEGFRIVFEDMAPKKFELLPRLPTPVISDEVKRRRALFGRDST